MKLTTDLENIRGSLSACLKCHECTYGPRPEHYGICPIYERGQIFTTSAGGLLYLAKAILNGQLDYNSSLAELAYTCIACGACDNKCIIVRSANPNMDLSDIIRLLRYELVKRGIFPKGPLKKMYEEVKENGDLLGIGKQSNMQFSSNVDDAKTDTLLIAQGVHPNAAGDSYNAALELLKKTKRPVSVFDDSGGCGTMLYDLGFWEQLPALVESKWEKIKAFGDKIYLFLDPHSQEFMTNKYAKIIDNAAGFQGQHLSEVLLEAFGKGELESHKHEKITVSYHDPCFLGRGLGIYDAPRKVLSYLDGIELVEMKRNREQSFCCGARAMGGYFENFSEGIAKERIKEFTETKADILITACSYCKEIFRKVLGKEANRVKDLAEFVIERVV
jgi:Fe-S oxidoreductase